MRPSFANEIFALRGPVFERMTDAELFEFCQLNRDLRIERTADYEILLMAPTGSESGKLDSEVTIQLGIWNKQFKLGSVFSSSTGFTLPDNSMLSPDTSWIATARWEALAFAQRKGFAPVCPEFIVELKSPSDSIKVLQAKMEVWRTNGVRLGWLLVPETETVYIYREGRSDYETEIGFDHDLSGEPVLPGFALDLRELRALLS